jgi:hypothetical protein
MTLIFVLLIIAENLLMMLKFNFTNSQGQQIRLSQFADVKMGSG